MNFDEFSKLKPEDKFGNEYQEHKLFTDLEVYIDFYDSISFSVMHWMSVGTKSIVNINTYAYSSIKGTLESIFDVLKKGRINDAYALLRKYFDSTIINTYCNLYLEDNHSWENLIVEKIDNWMRGKEKLPTYRVMSKYIKESSKYTPINKLLAKDNRYQKIRIKCNDHMHYNYYHNLLINDNEIHRPNRVEYLDAFAFELGTLFIQHFVYTFYLNGHYMMSSDHVDYLDLGMTPPRDSQYWVSPPIQKVFDNKVKTARMDLADELRNSTNMHLD
jgi:hypothetical protein